MKRMSGVVLNSGACAFFGNLGIDIFSDTFLGGNLDVLDIIHVKGWSPSIAIVDSGLDRVICIRAGFYL